MTASEKTTKAMKQALEALNMAIDITDTGLVDFKKHGVTSDKDIDKKLSTAASELSEALGKMKHIEAMQKAIDAIEAYLSASNDEEDNDAHENLCDAWAALREALAEQQAQQEPVAYSEGRTLHWHDGKGVNDAQLYLAPPQRQPWVNLTDAEIDDLENAQRQEFGQLCDAEDIKMLARAVGDKLREKNAAQRQPLTEMDIMAIAHFCRNNDQIGYVLEIARAIEAAHGIKEKNA